MKTVISALFAAVVLSASFTQSAVACYGGCNPNSHTVQGHYRSNGTYVESYQRTNPNSSVYDNYSYGN